MLLPNTLLNISMVLWRLFFAGSSICHLSTENVKSAPMKYPVFFKSFQEKKKKTTRTDDKWPHQRMNEFSYCINTLSLRNNMLKITF